MNRERLNKVLMNMKRYGLYQMIITSPQSIFYLLNEWIHPGERMLALYINTEGTITLIINKLFPVVKDIGAQLSVYDDSEDPISYLSQVVDEHRVLGIDKEWPSHFLIRLMKKLPSLKVEVGSYPVDNARMIKSREEIMLLKKASAVNDMAVSDLILEIRKGVTELEAGKALNSIYAKYGTDRFSFEPLICYGKNAAEPHHSSDNTMIKKNNCIIIDIGGITDNYCSDITRSLFFGEPDDEYRRIYDLVLKANLAGIAAVKPGVRFSDIDRAAREIIESEGYGRFFTHRTGHNVGICVHEYPDVSSANDMIVEEGMVFSIEPGVYIEDKYGVRIEDLVVVIEDGCEVLNKYPKDLMIFHELIK